MLKDRIKELRTKSNLTVGAFAESIGISRPSISNYEAGRKIPSEKTLNKIAEVYQVSVDWLKGEVEEIKEAAKEKTSAENAATAVEEEKPKAKRGRKPKMAAESVSPAVEEKAGAAQDEGKKPEKKRSGRVKKDVVSDEMNIVIQSPLGGELNIREIASKLPKGVESVYVRVDENKLYWVKKGETGSVDIW